MNWSNVKRLSINEFLFLNFFLLFIFRQNERFAKIFMKKNKIKNKIKKSLLERIFAIELKTIVANNEKQD